MMEYRILMAGSSTELERLVNSFISQGWTLQGGVCSTKVYDHDFLSQAMIKESE